MIPPHWSPIDAALAVAMILPQIMLAAFLTFMLVGAAGEIQEFLQRRLVAWWTGKTSKDEAK